MRWQDDDAFVEALGKRRYLERTPDGDLTLYLSHGLYLYMHELWLDGVAHATVESSADGDDDVPSQQILEKARRLQALALDDGAAPQERDTAWREFQKIWQRYKLPVGFGIK